MRDEYHKVKTKLISLSGAIMIYLLAGGNLKGSVNTPLGSVDFENIEIIKYVVFGILIMYYWRLVINNPDHYRNTRHKLKQKTESLDSFKKSKKRELEKHLNKEIRENGEVVYNINSVDYTFDKFKFPNADRVNQLNTNDSTTSIQISIPRGSRWMNIDYKINYPYWKYRLYKIVGFIKLLEDEDFYHYQLPHIMFYTAFIWMVIEFLSSYTNTIIKFLQ